MYRDGWGWPAQSHPDPGANVWRCTLKVQTCGGVVITKSGPGHCVWVSRDRFSVQRHSEAMVGAVTDVLTSRRGRESPRRWCVMGWLR
jgi:hypothetical protein